MSKTMPAREINSDLIGKYVYIDSNEARITDVVTEIHMREERGALAPARKVVYVQLRNAINARNTGTRFPGYFAFEDDDLIEYDA